MDEESPTTNKSNNKAKAKRRPQKDWDERCEDLKAYKAEYGSFAKMTQIDNSLYCWVHYQRMHQAKLSCERREKLEAIGFLSTTAKATATQQQNQHKPQQLTWNARFNQLQKNFIDKIPVTPGSTLAIWIKTQRTKSRAGKLSEVQRQKLESVGIVFEGSNIDHWKSKYSELAVFQEAHGHCKVHHIGDPSLYRWIHHQRTRKQQGKLDEDQELLLKRIGLDLEDAVKPGERKLATGLHPGSCQSPVLDDDDYKAGQSTTHTPWEVNFDQLVAFKKSHGHCRVTPEHDPTGSLYQWVQTQSMCREQMSREQLLLLNQLGLEWDTTRVDEQWIARYRRLVAFQKAHGHCRVRGDRILYDWVESQRLSQKILDDAKLNLLNKIWFEWTPCKNNDQWRAQYDQLVEFQNKHGHCLVTAEHNSRLAQWVRRQRHDHKELKGDKVLLLNQIGFAWEGRRKGGPKTQTTQTSTWANSTLPENGRVRGALVPAIKNTVKNVSNWTDSPTNDDDAISEGDGQAWPVSFQIPTSEDEAAKTLEGEVGFGAGAAAAANVLRSKNLASHNVGAMVHSNPNHAKAAIQFAHAISFHDDEEGRRMSLDTSRGVERLMPLKRQSSAFPRGGEADRLDQTYVAERPALKRARLDDEEEEYESSEAYFARKRTPYDTFFI